MKRLGDAAESSGENASRRLRRLRWAGMAVVLVLVAATAIIIAFSGGGEGGELSEAQWSLLLRQMGTGAAPAEAAAPLAGSGATPAADSSSGVAGSRSSQDSGSGATPATDPGSTPTPTVGQPPATGVAESADARLGATGRPATAEQRLAPADLAADVGARQRAEYRADRVKTIVELQQFRQRSNIEVNDADRRQGTATLINLNPRINAWYLLELEWQGEDTVHRYDLANASPQGQSIVLQPDFRHGVMVANAEGARACDLWSSDNPQRLDAAVARNTPYVMLCDERVALRLNTTGRRTTTERVTDFLRDTVWGGEAITVFVRETFFQDAFLSTADLAGAAGDGRVSQRDPTAPRPARLDPSGVGKVLDRSELGLTIERGGGSGQVVGEWYPLRDNPRVFASTLRPDLIAPDILASHTDIVIRLDEVEAEALAYLVAFDLDAFEVAFSLGTDHPRLGWSDRVPEERRDAALPGPDGIEASAPLVRTGIIPGTQAARSVATFTGGFKRTHGGFRYGELAMINNGSHYGFIEDGVVFSKLQPGLATIYVLDDGSFDMKTWAESDNALLERVRYARQNGVPIIERAGIGAAGVPGQPGVPGAMVSRYGAGNWSGSQEGKYRTLRAGACLQETSERRFLVYAYFSSATPSAMARVFQAYGCTYGMLLDMNALEHTYMAVYSVRGSELLVQHLVRGMEVLDKTEGDRLLPRFLGFADNRDFFYLLRRDPAARRSTETGS